MCRIKIVFDAVVAAARHFLRYFSPFITELTMQLEYLELLGPVDSLLVNLGIQMIVPTI